MRLVGFDPGGQDNFGWAVLLVGDSTGHASLKTGVCSNVVAAVERVSEVVGDAPTAIGIDAPLFWTAAGDRQVDAIVRKLVCAAGGRSGTVGHVNSLRGACLVQGALAAHRVAELWPSALITEAHPKALLRVSCAARDFITSHLPEVPTEHERDAALAAYAAWAGASALNGWRDLSKDESAPFFPSGRKVSYWFPFEELSNSKPIMVGEPAVSAGVDR